MRCGDTYTHLVNKVFICILDVELLLEVDSGSALLKDLLLQEESGTPHVLSLQDILHQAARSLKLLPYLLEFVGA